ncbi:hypothetical protein [Clostridium sp.]|uniref:hypothetical protein n=1 Tax=Clostridium sp. TaxID=1506 RepID=UPI002850207E|nr:hypothetical protein [Clostridium sp.]MDR3598836.1 hypothetical protein [Clostridium sp.]
MKSENYSERIHYVFAKNISLFPHRKIELEADWQTGLYCDLKDEFIEDKNILILLEERIRIKNKSRKKLNENL